MRRRCDIARGPPSPNIRAADSLSERARRTSCSPDGHAELAGSSAALKELQEKCADLAAQLKIKNGVVAEAHAQARHSNEATAAARTELANFQRLAESAFLQMSSV